MDCRQVCEEELVGKYLLGQLVGAVQDDFEVHILECQKCLRAMEALQAVREDLGHRAHEIRLLPAPGPVHFGWRWLAVACGLVMVCGLGVLQFRRMHPQHGIVAATAPQTAPPSKVAQSQELQTDVARGVTGLGLSTSSQHEKGIEVQNTVTKPRSPLGAAPPGPSSQEPGRTKGSAKTEVAEAPASSDSGGHSIPANEDKSVAAVHPQESGKKPELVSDEAEAELFRLGTVQAPPYSFSGVASTKLAAKYPLGSGLSGGSKSSGSTSQRAEFQSAMFAYVEGRYEDATGLLENDIESEPKAPDANLYLGVCKLLLGRPADSLAPLKTSLEKEKSPFAQSAHFYLAKAYVQMRELAEAEAQLQAAASMPGRLSAEANAELIRLRALRAQEEKPKPSISPKP